ncbi:uncharacterized protein LOC127004613 isoform X2 [Eriocheir sinensis]|uniref:uncharacterized protein LOC127004613 isoform X2 n=1 Tax=Eriocheir sinensis TaxID=95602 RepID=UPI0021C80F7C|nr:uncharacterized protein LOC127004613 isoform X2 [Eriocheir sinensis]
MKSLLLLLLPLVLGKSTWPSETFCYTEPDLGGSYDYFAGNEWDLSQTYVDNDIESVNQTGMWIYYENYNFNGDEPGLVYFGHGIDIVANFPGKFANRASSLSSAGSYARLNADTITLYEGTSFTGKLLSIEYYPDQPSLYDVAGKVSSFIVVGTSPWTIYTGEDYTGNYWCVYATERDTSSDGRVLDVGMFPSIEEAGIPDNSIQSVRKGCWGKRVAKAPELKVDGRQKNGAWGRLE